MSEEISHFLDTALAVVLGVFAWIGKKFSDRLDADELRLTRIEVELAAQHERDISVEKRMSGLEKKLEQISDKLDRLLEMMMQRKSL
tara:strand:- start:1058 stop:1318 length:261 start_codon:yes stop_codon:yes gene_type:complete